VTADARVEEAIAAKKRGLHGNESCQFRIYETLSDVDGDGREDFLVVFGIDGAEGNAGAVIQFLAVFASGSQWQPVVAEVGRRGQRIVRGIDRGPGTVIRLGALEYGPSDAMCCPSRKVELRLALRNGKITPVGE
jgi:hypothetical protein